MLKRCFKDSLLVFAFFLIIKAETIDYTLHYQQRAKAANLDAIHDTVHEMARDEARHGKAFAGLLKRYFG